MTRAFLRFSTSMLLLGSTHHAAAAVRYVDANSAHPVPPFTNWATAAVFIQHAVDAAAPGDEVLVTNGVYALGSRTFMVPGPSGTMITGAGNRVAVTKPITVRSVNGPEVTLIEGYKESGTFNGAGSVRCAYLAGGAVLSGFTLTNGATLHSYDAAGGGVYCESTNVTVTNCVLTGNSAGQGGGASLGTLVNCSMTGNRASIGGGAFGALLNRCTLTGNSASSGGGACLGTLNHCVLTGNSARQGGGATSNTLNHCSLIENTASAEGAGAYAGTLNGCWLTGNSASGSGGGACAGILNHCTLTGNSASRGGGASSNTLNNCILYFNDAGSGPNYHSATLNYCCTTPFPSNGSGHIASPPELAIDFRLSANSPCRGAGSSAYTHGLDMDGEAWLDPPSMGCDEYRPEGITGDLSVAINVLWTNLPVGITLDLTADVNGRPSAIVWDFGDGMVVTNQPHVSHAWSAPGDYPVTLRAFNATHPEGVSATVVVGTTPRAVHYVSSASTNPVAPFSSWATAAAVIQHAVDAADPGDEVVVTNGVYATGGRALVGMPGGAPSPIMMTSNRVAVTKPLTVRSVNGPEVTLIQGYQVPGEINGDGAVRCVYLADGAVLSGFTLTNGATLAVFDCGGGGVWCESTNALVTNCILTANSLGGAEGGTLNHCILTGNWGYGGSGGASGSVLNYCALTGNGGGSGGGAYGCMLNNCTLMGNRGCDYGGGAMNSTLNHCVLTGNEACEFGSAALGCTLNNCTITGNGGGAYGAVWHDFWGNPSILNNCIVYFNPSGNYAGIVSLNHCCTWPLPTSGVGNITNEPAFVDLEGGNLRLQASSPCINAGNNAYASGATDPDGRPRVVGGAVDIGAYEYQGPEMGAFIGWLEQYGLPTDGSADFTDNDTDTLNNWQEWRCGTIPTNAFSVLRLLTPVSDGTNLTVTWEGVANRSYFLESGPDLSSASAFVRIATNISGQASTTSFVDTNAVAASPRFYRVGVE